MSLCGPLYLILIFSKILIQKSQEISLYHFTSNKKHSLYVYSLGKTDFPPFFPDKDISSYIFLDLVLRNGLIEEAVSYLEAENKAFYILKKRYVLFLPRLIKLINASYQLFGDLYGFKRCVLNIDTVSNGQLAC